MGRQGDFYLPSLDEIIAGSVFELSPPTRDEVIQVDLPKEQIEESSKRKLRVDIGFTEVSISRADGVPIQVEQVNCIAGLARQTRNKLIGPVGRLTLARVEVTDMWNLTDGRSQVVGEPKILGEFFKLIADFAIKKQNDLAALAIHEKARKIVKQF